MTDNNTREDHREPTTAENRVVILALAGFFAIVLAVALVPSFLKKEPKENIHPLPPPVECMKGADPDNLASCQKARAFEVACQKGDVEACLQVGGFYLKDDNMEFNRQIGIKWLDYACHVGSNKACDWLNNLLEDLRSAEHGR